MELKQGALTVLVEIAPGKKTELEMLLRAIGSDIKGWKPGDRVSFPGNHASAELLTLGHERGRLWRLPPKLDAEKAAVACIARYGFGASIRVGFQKAWSRIKKGCRRSSEGSSTRRATWFVRTSQTSPSLKRWDLLATPYWKTHWIPFLTAS